MARKLTRRQLIAGAAAAGAGAGGIAAAEILLNQGPSPRRRPRAEVASISDWGARVDGVSVGDGRIGAGSRIIASASARFTRANATPGKPLILTWPDGHVVTTIDGLVDSEHVAAAIEMPASAAGVTVHWATDDRVASQRAIDATSRHYLATGAPQQLMVPPGIWYCAPNLASDLALSYACQTLLLKPGVILSADWRARLLLRPVPCTRTTADVRIPAGGGVTVPVVSTAGFDATLSPRQIQGYLQGTGGFNPEFTVLGPTQFAAQGWNDNTAPPGTVIPAGTIIQQISGWVGIQTDSPFYGSAQAGTCDSWQVNDLVIDGTNAIGIENGSCCGLAIGQASNYSLRLAITNTAGKPVFSYPKLNTNSHWTAWIRAWNCWTNAADFSVAGSYGSIDLDAWDCNDPGGAEVAFIGDAVAPAAHITARIRSANWGTIDVSGDDILLDAPQVVLPSGALGPAISVSGSGITVRGGHLDVTGSNAAGAIEATVAAVDGLQVSGTTIVCNSSRAIYAPPPPTGSHSALQLTGLAVTPCNDTASGCGAYITADGLTVQGCHVIGNARELPSWELATSTDVTYAQDNRFDGVTVDLPPGAAS